MRPYDTTFDGVRELVEEGEADYEKPDWAAPVPSESAGALELSEAQVQQLEEILQQDQRLKEEEAAILAGLRDQGVVEQELGARGPGVPVRGSTQTLMSSKILKEIAAAQDSEEEGQGRSVALAWTIAKHGAKIVAQVLRRYWHGRDHGLYTTVVEEVLRHLYLDNLGLLTWGLIKDDTKDAFGGDPSVHGGTAFVRHLAGWWREGREISLVGHSTGAIYIGHFLEEMDRVLPPEAKANVAFLAPACTFEFLGERLDLFERRVGHWRNFSLKDEIEAGYWEVPGYRGSLLYMVSGLAEGDAEDGLDQVDMPLVGMQRYFDQAETYDSRAVRRMRDYAHDKCVWSVIDGGTGRRSSARKHGDFDEDDQTMQSVVEFLSNPA